MSPAGPPGGQMNQRGRVDRLMQLCRHSRHAARNMSSRPHRFAHGSTDPYSMTQTTSQDPQPGPGPPGASPDAGSAHACRGPVDHAVPDRLLQHSHEHGEAVLSRSTGCTRRRSSAVRLGERPRPAGPAISPPTSSRLIKAPNGNRTLRTPPLRWRPRGRLLNRIASPLSGTASR